MADLGDKKCCECRTYAALQGSCVAHYNSVALGNHAASGNYGVSRQCAVLDSCSVLGNYCCAYLRINEHIRGYIQCGGRQRAEFSPTTQAYGKLWQ